MNISTMVAGSPIDDVVLKTLTAHEDVRGSFTEVFHDGWGSVFKPRQFSVVSSAPGVMRGCHFHLRHDECFCIISGEASVGLRDERIKSATRNRWSLYHLYADDPVTLIFPRGVVHGWYFHKQSIHLQGVSEPYSEYSASDNHLVNWLDPELEIPWPANTAVTSPGARNAMSLAELRKSIDLDGVAMSD